MNVKFSAQAWAEILEAHAWYDGREAGIGEAFRAELAATVHRIAEQPQAFAISFANMRRAMLRRFPYFVIYEAFPDVVLVFGVIHGARDPEAWKKRTGG